VTAPRLFDGEQLIRDGAVAIRGDQIVAAGSRKDVDVDAERTIALRAATSRAATVLAIDGLGRIEEGSPADVVAVRGDPMEELHALSEPMLIVLSGKIQIGG
jgi:imidazolonepropionase-like amidohydrolase